MKNKSEQRKPRMVDVARLAGVGTMTVSRLLTGGTNVNEEASERIRWAIEKLNYRPNEAARALRAQKARTIGVIVPHLQDPFFSGCCYAIDEVAKGFGYSVIVTSSNSQQSIEQAEAQKMVRRHVEGIIVIPADSIASHFQDSEFDSVPVIALDRPVEESRVDSILVQNKAGARVAVEHLIFHGHSRIAFIGIRKDLYTMGCRYQGYRQAMASAGLASGAYHDFTKSESMVALLSRMLAQANPPTALFSASNRITQCVLLALRELKVQVPAHLAFISFDDLEMAEFWDPTPTAIRQPVRELGRVAADLLFRRMKEDARPEKGERIMLPVELMIRESCGCGSNKTVAFNPMPFVEDRIQRSVAVGEEPA